MRTRLTICLIISFVLPWSLKAAELHKFAIIIGIAGYPKFEKSNRLQFCDNDARQFNKFVQSVQGGSFSKDNIRLLLNSDATSDAIWKSIKDIGRRVHREDIVYIYFSGHCITNEVGQAFFMPYDADPQNPEAAGLRVDIFISSLRSYISSKYLLSFIDACHAGSALTTGGTSKGSDEISPIIKEVWNQEMQKQKEPVWMTFLSAGSNQKSWEDNDLKGGIYTAFLIRGLNGEADLNSDGKVTAGELERYLMDQVEEYSRRKYVPQTPTRSAEFFPDFTISVVPSPPLIPIVVPSPPPTPIAVTSPPPIPIAVPTPSPIPTPILWPPANSDSSDSVSYWDGDAVRGQPTIFISLSKQRAYFYKNDVLVGVSEVSTGKKGFETPVGDFQITKKTESRRFLQIRNATHNSSDFGMSVGFLPGYPSSSGSILMPSFMLSNFYDNVKLGTPVKIVK